MAKQTVDFALMQFRKRPRTKNDDEDDGKMTLKTYQGVKGDGILAFGRARR
jgi:hypothetical protein